MRHLTWPEWFLISSLGLMAAGLAVTFFPVGHAGARDSASFQGQATPYWRAEIKAWLGRGQMVSPPLVAYRDPKAIPVLVDLVRDKDPAIRKAAIDALGEMGPRARDALPVLRQAANDPVTGTAAGNAVNQIEARDSEPDWNRSTRTRLLRLIEQG
jgi:hypothetical protein